MLCLGPMQSVFTRFLEIDVPHELAADARSGRSPAFVVRFRADGDVPFPQVIVWEGGHARLFNGPALGPAEDTGGRAVTIPAGLLPPGAHTVQIEGCRRADIEHAHAEDWVKHYHALHVRPTAAAHIEVGPTRSGVVVYFGIHKHMHQPYYDAVDERAWDGEKDQIFGSRHGAYTHFIPTAVRQYIEGGLAHAGLSTSWSRTLIEQLDRAAHEGLCGGAFAGWNRPLRELTAAKTVLGHPRIDFTAFHAFHALLPLIPDRDIVRGVEQHREAVRAAFGVEASNVMFPPETAFHVRMIPALRAAGVDAVIYDSIHRFRACKDYPYAGPQEGMLPPNPAEQSNPAVSDWLQLHNVWAGSRISPSLLRPETVAYEDPEGTLHTIIGVPAERYIGNEDARGGFGALQYPSVLGQVYDRIVADGSFDPAHPPFFLLHSDGDNYGGGADSYYGHNTGQLVRWLQEDRRFELTTVLDYLERFPVDPRRHVHIEPGSWSGADNGDPRFSKWFSRAEQPYSPDLNSWAVLTAFQNIVHAIEDAGLDLADLDWAYRRLLTAETSCYWYWTGQDVWDRQVTHAANAALARTSDALPKLAGRDRTAPTIFPPWVSPENPGGKAWGPHGNLVDAPRQGILHTFVYDVSGLRDVELVIRPVGGREQVLPLRDHGPYPTQTGARVVATHFTAELPVGAGDIRYFVRARDGRGNVGQSALERIFLA